MDNGLYKTISYCLLELACIIILMEEMGWVISPIFTSRSSPAVKFHC